MKKEILKEAMGKGKKFNNPFAKKWKGKLEGLAKERALKSLIKKE